MFLAFGFRVHPVERHAELFGEVDLPEPVRAQHVQRHALTFGGEFQVRAVAVNEAFAFEPLGQLQQQAIAEPQLAF